ATSKNTTRPNSGPPIGKTDQENHIAFTSEEKQVIDFLDEYYQFYNRDKIYRNPIIKKIDQSTFRVSVEQCLSKGGFKEREIFWDSEIWEITLDENNEFQIRNVPF